MIFSIEAQDPHTGKLYRYQYDNQANRIQTSEGIPLCLEFDPRFERMRFTMREDGDRSCQHAKSRHLKQLRIQMGIQCNYSCRYCAQRTLQKMVPIVPSDDKTVEKFLSRLSSSIDSADAIHFTGGEVFVYRKKLIPLVAGLKKLYPDARMGIITNGSLLTKELADWMLDNRIGLVISHDGPSFTRYRDAEDIFDKPSVLEAIQHYYDRNLKEGLGLDPHFNVVVTPDNRKLSQLPDYFRRKTGRNVQLQFESIVKLNSKTLGEVPPFTSDEAYELVNEIFQAGIDFRKDQPLGYLAFMADRVAGRLVRENRLTALLYPCDNAQQDTVAVDISGNLLSCQGLPAFKTAYGEIEDLTTLHGHAVPWTERKECPDCQYLVSCLGGCSVQSEEDHEISCRTLRLWNMGLFYAAWFRLFGTVITAIEPLEIRRN